MRTRIEIQKAGQWLELFLGDEKQIKYNALANRVGSMSQREISHSNTFSLPYVFQNIQALGINVFNAPALAKAFNSKYLARYYVRDKLLQEGYLVINNTESGVINVNFIDGALNIVEKWGSMSYYDLLYSDIITIPEPYRTNLDFMKTYSMSKTSILATVPNLVGKTYPICKFPNNLNAIGDKFQIRADGTRLDNGFNPYQSRPIFNIKALFDIAIETFGYTAYYDDSIDWDNVALTYMIDKDLSQSQKAGAGTIVTTYPEIGTNTSLGSNSFVPGISYYNFVYPIEVNASYMNDFTPPLYPEFPIDPAKDYGSLDRCVLKPSTTNFTTGTMNWKWKSTSPPSTFFGYFSVKSNWQPLPGFEGMQIFRYLIPTSFSSTPTPTGFDYEVTVNKTELGIKPTGAGEFLGIIMMPFLENFSGGDGLIHNMVYAEGQLGAETVAYDAFDQYDSDIINLAHASPRGITIKELLSAVMQKEGILMSFNNRQKTIKLFSYSSYITRRNEGNFSDWTQYHRKYTPPLWNTDYGGEFAAINEVGLNSPFKGNTFKLILSNQTVGSKYKEYTTNYNSKFKDIESINLINNSITPYFEYTNKGLGLVEIGTPLGTLTQVRADGATQGTFSGLQSVLNVNYASLPMGVTAWYNLVDASVRCQATFLLPLNLIKNLELAEPIYVESLGGFYIIEEVEEYTDAQTPVKVKLIKLIIEDSEVVSPILQYSYQYSSGYAH